MEKKKKILVLYTTTWMNPKIIMLSERNLSPKKSIPYDYILMRF